MALTSVIADIGGAEVPNDIRVARRNVLDFFQQLGQPLIHKHRWTEDDVTAGRAQFCPYCRNKAYRQGSQADPYCFGTGFLGGFADGVIVPMSIADTSEDVFKVTPEGLLMRSRHPICSAPWEPDIADGDLLIEAEFDAGLFTVVSTGDRYVTKNVTPVTPRGSRRATGATLYPISQQFQIDSLPNNHPYMSIAVVFDASALPPSPTVPPGGDPDDYGQTNLAILELPVFMPVAAGQGQVTVTFTD